jgi:Holliday junction resolvase RusA-like endonuclease
VNETLEFTIYMRAEPQGSARAFVIAGRARVTTDNKKIKPFRSEVTRMALAELNGRQQPLFPAREPVHITVKFGFMRPPSAKRRNHPSVKPDIDKLVRAVSDALTGVAFHDDAQVVSVSAQKLYAPQDYVTVMVWRAE